MNDQERKSAGMSQSEFEAINQTVGNWENEIIGKTLRISETGDQVLDGSRIYNYPQQVIHASRWGGEKLFYFEHGIAFDGDDAIIEPLKELYANGVIAGYEVAEEVEIKTAPQLILMVDRKGRINYQFSDASVYGGAKGVLKELFFRLFYGNIISGNVRQGENSVFSMVREALGEDKEFFTKAEGNHYKWVTRENMDYLLEGVVKETDVEIAPPMLTTTHLYYQESGLIVVSTSVTGSDSSPATNLYTRLKGTESIPKSDKKPYSGNYILPKTRSDYQMSLTKTAHFTIEEWEQLHGSGEYGDNNDHLLDRISFPSHILDSFTRELVASEDAYYLKNNHNKVQIDSLQAAFSENVLPEDISEKVHTELRTDSPNVSFSKKKDE